MITDHREAFFRQRRLVFEDVIQIFVVTPGEHHVIESAVGLVDTIFARVDGVIVVGIVDEGIGVDDRWVICTTDNERVLKEQGQLATMLSIR